jgi:hypothetical protein
VAYGLRPARPSPGLNVAVPGAPLSASAPAQSAGLPQVPAKPVARGISSEELRSKIDQFLASRGYKGGEATVQEHSSPSVPSVSPPPAVEPVAFVCEDDVRQAMRNGTTIALGEKTIVTPAARDLGTAHHVFAPTSWPR